MSTINFPTLNPQIPSPTNPTIPKGIGTVFNSLKDPSTHVAAVEHLLNFLHGPLYNSHHLMERYFTSYADEIGLVDRMFDGEDIFLPQYFNLTMSEDEALFGPPDPEDPIIQW